MQQGLIDRQLKTEAKAWLKRPDGTSEVLRIVAATEANATVECYEVYTAYDLSPDYFGRILFDRQGYWIYDGSVLTVAEQEQVAHFITNYVERIV